jgi:hypothetical protein
MLPLVRGQLTDQFILGFLFSFPMKINVPHVTCCNPSFGLTTKARACKGAGQESHFMLPRVQESGREWTPTLPSELPLWELESQWTFKYSEGNCKEKISLDWKFPYNIKNLLEHRCLKWALMMHLNTLKTSYGQKKGQESNCQFDCWTLKVNNCSNFLACRWCATYCWKNSQQRIQLCFRPHLNWRFACKVMGLQSFESPNFGNFEIPTWESRDKMTFGCWSRGQV